MAVRRASPEAQIQKALIKHLQAYGRRGMIWFHSPNGGRRDVREAANLKRMGVVAGVSDLILLHAGIFYALELKAEDGKVTPAQIEWQQQVLRAGGVAAITFGIDNALMVLKQWGLIRA